MGVPARPVVMTVMGVLPAKGTTAGVTVVRGVPAGPVTTIGGGKPTAALEPPCCGGRAMTDVIGLPVGSEATTV